MKWRVEFPGEFYDRNEQSVVYFNAQSGDTHLISDFASQIIHHLSDNSLELDDIIEKLAPDIASQDLPELALAIPDILRELVALDIVEQI